MLVYRNIALLVPVLIPQGNFPIPKTAHLSKEDKKHFWGKITASVNIGSVNPIVPNAPFLYPRKSSEKRKLFRIKYCT